MKPSTPAKWLDNFRGTVLMVQFSNNYAAVSHPVHIIHGYDDTDMPHVMEYPYAQEM